LSTAGIKSGNFMIAMLLLGKTESKGQFPGSDCGEFVKFSGSIKVSLFMCPLDSLLSTTQQLQTVQH
jgi:hypothetical protein